MFVHCDAAGCHPDGHDLATGADRQPLASFPAGCVLEPRLSPDGATLVFLRFANPNGCTGTSEIWTAPVGSGPGTVLATAPANAWFDMPNWSPDGTTLLYTQEQDDAQGGFVSSQLYTIPAAGGTAAAIGGGGWMAFDGTYSPDGTRIAAAVAIDTPANYLGIMNADGSNVVNLPATGLSLYSPYHPAWSPDGARISYEYVKATVAGTPSHPNSGIAVVNADGSGNHVLTSTSGASTAAWVSSWSADGSEIYYDAAPRSTSTGELLAYGTIYATDSATGTYRTTVVAATSTDSLGDPFFVGPGPSSGSASTYTPVTPTRVQPRVLVGPGGSIDVRVSGGTSPAPSGATAVTVNLTGVKSTASTYLQIYPRPVSGSAAPVVSNLNLVAGQTAAVAAQVTVPASGYVRIRNAFGTTGVILDVTGYFTAGTTAAGFVALPQPLRALDASIGQGAHRDVGVTGLAGAPAHPVSVVLNLTASRPSAATYESVVPAPLVGAPTVSNLNLTAGATRANLVTVAVGTDGKISVFNFAGTVRTIVDVVGYYASDPGSLPYYPLSPTRILDTRYGTNTLGGSTAAIGQGLTLDLLARGTTTTTSAIVSVPATAQAVVFGLTAISPTRSTYLTAYASPGTRPATSSLNAAPGTIVPNLVVSGVGSTSGTVGIFNFAGSTPVIADLAGYYAP